MHRYPMGSEPTSTLSHFYVDIRASIIPSPVTFMVKLYLNSHFPPVMFRNARNERYFVHLRIVRRPSLREIHTRNGGVLMPTSGAGSNIRGMSVQMMHLGP